MLNLTLIASALPLYAHSPSSAASKHTLSLSNGLENAVIATAQISDEKKKTVRVNCQMHKGNLLIYIKNSYEWESSFGITCPKATAPNMASA